jgi:hypothetical protein
MRILSFSATVLLSDIISGQNGVNVQPSSEEFGHLSLEVALMNFVGIFDAIHTVCVV